jgi:hypothetical protein
MPQGTRDVYVPQNVYTGSKAVSPSYTMGTALIPGVQQLVHEIDHSFPPLPRLGMGGDIYI